MYVIKKYYGVWCAIILISSVATNLSACPCFNSGFLYAEFKDDKHTQCHIYKKRNIIYKIEIMNERYSATSTHTSCSMDTDHHDVYSQHNLFHYANHTDCIREILYTCNQLHINTLLRDD